MTQETRDILYNKQAHELNIDEVEYINLLLKKKWARSNFLFSAVFGTLAGFLLPLILSPLLIVDLNSILPIITIMGGVTGGLLGGMVYSMAPSLKFLGLTRKEWKELKKSGRLKELKQIVKLYEQSDKSYLDDLAEREEEISSEIQLKEEEKQSLINELVDLYAEKRAITGEEQLKKYTQEKVAEMLEIERNLLLKCLERNKKEQELLQENADSKTLSKAGKRSEKSIEDIQKSFISYQELN